MVSLDVTAGLTIAELCEKVNQKLGVFPLVKRTEFITDRTVHFYLKKNLLDAVSKGPGRKYSADTVWKILFIFLLQDQHGLSLEAIAPLMSAVPAETMRRVVTGEEPLELASADDSAAIERHRSLGMQVVRVPATGRAAGTPEDDDSWLFLARNDMFEMRARRGTHSATLRQLRQLATLANSIAEDKFSRRWKSADPSTTHERSDPMITHTPEQRPDRATDAPERLALVNDLEKAAAVGRALSAKVGHTFTAMVDAVRYACMPRHPDFRRPTEIRMYVGSVKETSPTVLQAHSDAVIEEAIAAELGKAAGEPYRVRITERSFGRGLGPDGEMRLTFQVGKA